MELALRAEHAEDWFYKGEGAANIVFGYRGTLPHLIGKVLRVPKIPKAVTRSPSKCEVLSIHEKLIWKDTRDLIASTSSDIAGQVFLKQVMCPLLGSDHVDAGVFIRVTEEFLQCIVRNFHSERPIWRIEAADVDFLSNLALLISDHSIFCGGISEDSCIAVEIKSKCGFLPSSSFIGKKNAVKQHISRFRMHQFLKRQEKEVLYTSEYDPLDLFSGSKDRITRAINALIKTPQNNFRVFLNGFLIFGGLGGGTDNTEFEAKQFQGAHMTAADRLKASVQEIGLHLDSLVELITEAICNSRVLEPLLEAQKLDSFDIEGAIHAYFDIVSEPCLVCRNANDAELLSGYASLHSLSPEESMKIVRDYLIAATAKDCSLIFCFRRSRDGKLSSKSLFLESLNQMFEYKANFIDLDLKPLKRMLHYYKLDQRIVESYMNNECPLGSSSDSTAGGPENVLGRC